MDNNKNNIQTLIAIIVLLILVAAGTYAYFAPQAGGTTSTNATVTSNTTDLLTFSINRDISFTVTQNDFQENGTNQSGDATATATLTPNNKTGSATMNYYLYLRIDNNPIEYSSTNTNELPELMLQVFDGSNQLVTLSGLGNQVTVKGVTGYDITGVTGLKTLLDNHAISASNNTATIENWRIVITLINHDFNQNDNTGKEVSAEIIIQQDELSLGFTGTIYRNNTNGAKNGASIIPVTGTQWVMTDGTQDYLNYNDQATCSAQLIELNAPNTMYCEEKSGTFGGVGSYETNVNNIRKNYNYYLKHEVEDNIIESTAVCIWYNNNEFCFESNYWVETGTGDAQHHSVENAIATMNKLQTAMETTLKIQADECTVSLYDDSAYCNFGSYSCTSFADGSINCFYDHLDYCFVDVSNGLSGCGYNDPDPMQ